MSCWPFAGIINRLDSRRDLIYATGGAYKSAATNNVYVAYNDLTGTTGCTLPANEPGTNASSTCKTRIWVARSTDGGTCVFPTPHFGFDQADLTDEDRTALQPTADCLRREATTSHSSSFPSAPATSTALSSP